MSNDEHLRPSRVVFTKQPESRFSGFFRIDEYEVSYEKFHHDPSTPPPKPEENMSKPEKLLVFDRGHAVAALLYDPVMRKVICVDQFRLPTYHKTKGADHRGTGWIYETAAGMIKDGETPYRTLMREVEEETGYAIKKAIPITSFHSSPGGSTEMVHLYLAEVSIYAKKSKGGGVENEDIRLVEMGVVEFLRRLDAREFTDPKLIISGYFLREHLRRSTKPIATGRAAPLDYKLKGSQDLVIGIRPGNMLDWKGIDTWVNSENTDMEMMQFHGRSVSATIRYHGAVKHPGSERVKADTIADELRSKRGPQGFVAPAMVIDTTSGELLASHGVKRIYHVAAVEGVFGTGAVTVDNDKLRECIDNVLVAIDRDNGKVRKPEALMRSVLVPIFGTGNGRAEIEEVAPLLVIQALAYLQSKLDRETADKREAGALRAIYLSAFDDRTELILRHIIEEKLADRLERI